MIHFILAKQQSPWSASIDTTQIALKILKINYLKNWLWTHAQIMVNLVKIIYKQLKQITNYLIITALWNLN